TGLPALTVAVLFLLSPFIAPLGGSGPAYAPAPAPLYGAGPLLPANPENRRADITGATPAALTAIVMPFTYSIANGLAFGFISYVVLKAITGKFRDIHMATLLVAILFVIKYAFFPD